MKKYVLLLKKLYEVFNIPVAIYQKNERLDQYPVKNLFQFTLEGSAQESFKIFNEICETAISRKLPFLFFEDDSIFYGVLKNPDDALFIFGPVSSGKVNERICHLYQCRHCLINKPFFVQYSLKEMAKLLVLATYLINGNDIDIASIQIANCNEAVVKWSATEASAYQQLNQSEQKKDHNSIEYEEKLLRLVREGNLEEMQKMVSGSEQLGDEHIGEVALDKRKRMEYLSVTLITLLSRAAVQGGLNYEQAYSLSDIYLKKLETCKDILEILALCSRAQIEFTKRVKNAKSEKNQNPYIARCKEYIYKYLQTPIKIEQLATSIGISRSYLSRKFQETEGITIQQYIIKERCLRAANMLKYSDYPISIISEYFCFSSQSHFGRQFKNYFGMTPKEYRDYSQTNLIESNKKKYIDAKKSILVL